MHGRHADITGLICAARGRRIDSGDISAFGWPAPRAIHFGAKGKRCRAAYQPMVDVFAAAARDDIS